MKSGPGGSGAQVLTPPDLLDRLAALIPSPSQRDRAHDLLTGGFGSNRERPDLAGRCQMADDCVRQQATQTRHRTKPETAVETDDNARCDRRNTRATLGSLGPDICLRHASIANAARETETVQRST